MSTLIFAYGSNMCLGRLNKYNVNPQDLGRPALLREYCLKFNKRSAKDCSGKANIEPSIGSRVWGVLYRISDDELNNLIKGEGPGYALKTIPVELGDRSIVDAQTFEAKTPYPYPLFPYISWYKRFLVLGAREHGLPAEYISDLEAIKATDDPDPVRNRENREINCSER